jgi:gamma-glutamyltranspeptidase/glutathione hydrolase
MGGHAQAQLHLQLLEGLAVEGLDPATVIGRPRWYVPPGMDEVLVESRDGLDDRLEGGGQTVRRVGRFDGSMGHAQAVVVDHERGVLVGAADPRSDGLALGF